MNRRKILGLTVATMSATVPGCSELLSDEGSGEDCPTVVDAGKSGGNSSQNVQIDVTVETEGGDPVAGATVKLADRGGTPDDRSGTTCADGTIRFVESVGPEPCNSLTLKLSEYDDTESLGCRNGGATLSHTFTVES